jgi:hypothetical protein
MMQRNSTPQTMLIAVSRNMNVASISAPAVFYVWQYRAVLSLLSHYFSYIYLPSSSPRLVGCSSEMARGEEQAEIFITFTADISVNAGSRLHRSKTDASKKILLASQ